MNTSKMTTPELVREFAAQSALVVLGKASIETYGAVVTELIARGVLD